MGLFLSLAGIIGRTPEEVLPILQNYIQTQGGGFTPATLDLDHPDSCVVSGAEANTTIAYPPSHSEWDDSSAYLSRHLLAPVFSFHIHDSDLWMFLLYDQGEVVTQFNPIPDYWDNTISPEELAAWRGDAVALCHHIPHLQPQQVERYLLQWDLENENPGKAYAQDEYAIGDEWQLLDFMRTLRLPYPLADPVLTQNQYFKLWTKHKASSKPIVPKENRELPWWKFW